MGKLALNALSFRLNIIFTSPCLGVFLRIRSTTELSVPQTDSQVETMRDLLRMYFVGLWRLVATSE